jgi:hypothetical protein
MPQRKEVMLHSFTIGTPANRPTSFLDDSALMKVAPSIFAGGKHESRSDRYAYIPTARVVEGLRNQGFAPVKVAASRVRDDSRHGFEKHMIRFRRIQADVVRVGDIFPEVVLVNAHDGTSSYQLSAGLYRLACSNGLVIPSGSAGEVRIKHAGSERKIIDDVIEGSFRVLEQSTQAIDVAGKWQRIDLSKHEQNSLANAAHFIRFADPEGNVETPIKADQLLQARRSVDQRSDLWTTFNRIQENVIRGGLKAITVDPNTGRRRKVSTREVKGIDGNVNLNKALWKLAEALAGIKTAN